MLQIKTIPKNISTSSILELLSFIYLTTISEGITHLVRKQLNVNTHMRVTTLLLANNNKYSLTLNSLYKILFMKKEFELLERLQNATTPVVMGRVSSWCNG